MITRTETVTVVLCAFIAMGMAVPTLLAAPLVPGMTIPAPAEPDPIGGAIIASQAVPFAAGTFSGQLSSAVISGDGGNPFPGGLTFTYLLTNDMTSTDTINRLTLTSFTGWATGVSWQPAMSPAAVPLLVDRSVNGSVVGFSFTGSPIPLAPGSSSLLLVVQTDALAYTNGSASVIDGSAVTGVATYAPVPEPVTLAVLAIGIAGVLFRRRQA